MSSNLTSLKNRPLNPREFNRTHPEVLDSEGRVSLGTSKSTRYKQALAGELNLINGGGLNKK